MAIPAAELTLVQGIQNDLANAKASMAAAKNKAEQLRQIATTANDIPGANHAFAAKVAFDGALAEIGKAHSVSSDRLLAQYGPANAGPVILGGSR